MFKMMTFDNYNTTKDNSSSNNNTTDHGNNGHNSHFYRQCSQEGGNNQQSQRQPPPPSSQQDIHLQQQKQQSLQYPFMQNLNTRVSPTLPFQQSIGNLNGATSSLTTATTMNTSPIWNSPFNLQQQPPPPQQQQYSQILPQQYQFSNRRNSLIDSSNIWSTNPTSSSLGGNTSGISTSIGGNNMWSSSNLFPTQQPQTVSQQQSSNIFGAPPLSAPDNYISTSSSFGHNRSSLISSVFTSSPPPAATAAAPQQQVQPVQSTQPPPPSQQQPLLQSTSDISPTQIFDTYAKRDSFSDTTTTTSTASSNTMTTMISDKTTLQMVDDYFENDCHERVKVTMKLLNERFFNEEKFLSDAYQLPKFPIENSLRNYQLILVGFKAGRIDVFYLPTTNNNNNSSSSSTTASISQQSNNDLMNLKVGDLVIVEADRGRDLGKVFKMNISIDEARLLKLLQFQEQQAALKEHVDNILDDISVKNLSDQQQQQQQQSHSSHQGTQQTSFSSNTTGGNSGSGSIPPPPQPPPTLHFPKSIISLAQPNEIIQILNKKQDEEKACRLCLAKIANATSGSLLGGPTSPATQDLLQMKLIDAEYQFDRKKLIFYYSTSRRIDFRDLVRELFRIYKTRIWMCAVIGLPYQITSSNAMGPTTTTTTTMTTLTSLSSPSSRRNSNSPPLAPSQQIQQQQGISRSGNFINPFMQQPVQPPQQQQQQQYTSNRIDRRLSFQMPSSSTSSTCQQQQLQNRSNSCNYYPPSLISFHNNQQSQQQQVPQQPQEFIPRRYSDSRSGTIQQQQQQQPQSFGRFGGGSLKFQFPDHQHQQQQLNPQQNLGSTTTSYLQEESMMLLSPSIPTFSQRCTNNANNDDNVKENDENENVNDRDKNENEDGDRDEQEEEEEVEDIFNNNHSGESFVLKSLVDSINH